MQLITKLRKNMKSKLLPLFDKLLLRKRSIVETVNDQLKNISQIEHSRHRSPVNFFVNLIAGLVATHSVKRSPRLISLPLMLFQLSSYELYPYVELTLNSMPEKGSSSSSRCTREARPTMPFLKSTGCVATSTFNGPGGMIMCSPARPEGPAQCGRRRHRMECGSTARPSR